MEAETSEVEAEAPAVEVEPEGPIVERISIGTLVVEKTVYPDGDAEFTEINTLRPGPDENYAKRKGVSPSRFARTIDD